MIVKFKLKYLGGGALLTTTFTPLALTDTSDPSVPSLSSDSTSSTTKSSKSTDTGKITDKDLMSMIKDIDGLPSDISAVIDSISNTLQYADSPGMMAGSMNTKYLQALKAVKTASFNKKEYDAAYKYAVTNDTLSETAITDRGRVVVMDKNNKITTKSIDELKNAKNVLILTNSDLLALRALSKPMDNSILSMVLGSVSINMVNKYIKDAASKIGSSDVDITGYSKSSLGLIEKGIEFLQSLPKGALNGMTLDGLYKTNYVSKNQINLAKLALDYIYSSMLTNMKSLLKLKSDGTDNGAKAMIGKMLSSELSQTDKVTPTLIEDEDGNKPGGKKSTAAGADDKFKMGMASALLADEGEQKDFTIVNGTSDGLHVTVTSLPIMKGSNAVGSTNLTNLLKSAISGICDWNSVTMGGVKIDLSLFNQAITTDGTAYKMDMPIDMLEYSNTGIIKPDLKSIANKEKADAEIKAKHLEGNYAEMNKIYEKYNMPSKFDNEGNLVTEHWTTFCVLNGVATSKAFPGDLTFTSTLEEINDDNQIDGYLSILSKAAGVKSGKTIDFDKASWWDKMLGKPNNLFSSNDLMYRGTIFIPMKKNEMNAAIGEAHYMTVALSLGAELALADSDLESEYVNPGNDLDE